MSNNGLPVSDVVGVSVTLGQRRTAGASAGDAYAEAAQGSAIAAAGSASSAKQAELGATEAMQGINEKAEQVSIDADRAELAADNAQNIADANTYYITPTDPDGTIAGIAGTPNGQSFRVGQGVGMGFKTYVNNNGVAVEVSGTPGTSELSDVIERLKMSNSAPVASVSGKNGFVVGDFLADGSYVAGLNEGIQITPQKLQAGNVRVDSNGLDSEKLAVTHFDSSDFVVRVMGRNGFYYDMPLNESTSSAALTDEFNIESRNARNIAMANNKLAKLNSITQSINCDVNIFMSFGQSLSTAMEGWPAISKTYYEHLQNLMFGDSVRSASAFTDSTFMPVNGASLKPLAAVVQQWSGRILTDAEVAVINPTTDAALAQGESPIITCVNYLRQRWLDYHNLKSDPRQFLAIELGTPGMPIEKFQPGQSCYQRAIDGLTKLRDYCVSQGKSVCVAGIFFDQGQYNYTSAGTNDKDEYKAFWKNMHSSLNTAIAELFIDQSAPPAWILSQTGGNWTSNDDVTIGQAQVEICEETPGVWNGGGTYHVTNKPSGHLDSNGYRWVGQMWGRTAERVLIRKANTIPMTATGHSIYGMTMISDYQAPVYPIVFDKPYVTLTTTDYASKGLLARDSLGIVDILSVDIVAESVTLAKLSRLTFGDVIVTYGSKTNNAGNGCIRDSDDTRATESYVYNAGTGQFDDANIPELVDKPYPLQNWCVASNITAEKKWSNLNVYSAE